MEKTRNLKTDQKNNVKAFCDKELFYEMYEQEGDFKEKKENIIANLQAFHYTNLNPLRVASVRGLNIHARANELLQMYNQAARKINWLVPEDNEELEKRKFIFHDRYMKMIKQVDEKENTAKLDSKNQGAGGPSYAYDETSNILLDRQAGVDGFNDINLKGADDFTADVDYNVFSNFAGGNAGGALHDSENENSRKFFRRLIKIFKNINFYNLLINTHAQASKDAEQVGVDDQ